ncbi:SigE family RNA polymerase sigma factor [Cellulosimicrobium cellulans]|uniref:SigE family RNA polymerase sigma factor n=1 Tax=Cellulosimicrobium cellulans TaxID=1710 RepID=UPI000848BD90|nr:SigE family RNA polymerase sigma factor [Cellulosimicrobium cellulans]
MTVNALAVSQDDDAPDDGPPDHVPLLRVATDREQEFTDFMEHAAPRLARTAWLLCGDAHQADELVQQALTKTYLRWTTARERDPYAYARRALATSRVDQWRRRRREVLVAPADVPESAVGSATAETHAERDRLVRALATLTRRQRRIVVLRHLVGLTEREVADDLGVSVGTVKSTASRGLAQLRSVLSAADAAEPRHTRAVDSTTGSHHPPSPLVDPTEGSPS